MNITNLSARQINHIYARALERGFNPDLLYLTIRDEFLQDAPRSGRPTKQTSSIREQVLAKKIGKELYGQMRHLLYCFITVEDIEFGEPPRKDFLEVAYTSDGRGLQSSNSGVVSHMIKRVPVTAGVRKLLKKRLNLSHSTDALKKIVAFLVLRKKEKRDQKERLYEGGSYRGEIGAEEYQKPPRSGARSGRTLRVTRKNRYNYATTRARSVRQKGLVAYKVSKECDQYTAINK
ncbi:predicted protein [Histoplasma mississippiense (nom. inval.)]|uniref:predicted protein n=1 Tax=Ajellomyces capsulatus (strain NAm1 / WU24) TaxID=2059318 RepID=UPI000157D0F5|nr:predicted protein [Histoplasma mississippiense (nom. inval.)]EDN11274.1 predicted protein [Histoplasma mississippiense (nom. inval.)]